MVMIDGGVELPELQYEVRDLDGRLWRLDFAWPESRLAAEYDKASNGMRAVKACCETNFEPRDCRSAAGRSGSSPSTMCVAIPWGWSDGSVIICPSHARRGERAPGGLLTGRGHHGDRERERRTTQRAVEKNGRTLSRLDQRFGGHARVSIREQACSPKDLVDRVGLHCLLA